MSFHMTRALGQSQVPDDVTISEVDLPPNLHFNRWGPVNGITDILRAVSPGFMSNFIPGGQQQPQVLVPQKNPLVEALPVVAAVAVGGMALWYFVGRK